MSPSAAGRWLDARYWAPGPLDAVLLERVAPLAREAAASGLLRRFFFLRHGEGGLHLRLRLLPAPGVPAAAVRAAVDERLAAGLPQGTWRLEWRPYDREALYFGETPESVYAELLNEATSRLALGLLAAPGGAGHTRRWLALAALLDALVAASVPGEARPAALAASMRFAREAAAGLGRPVDDEPASASPVLDAALQRARAAVGSRLSADPAVRRTARLLRRLRGRGRTGAFAATHALHLLCNKAGFTLAEEADLFSALSRAAGERSSRPPAGASDERVA